MFTVEQIKQAHSKVKTGVEFPAYIEDIKELGVISYETYVADGHTDYFGTANYRTTNPAKYDTLPIAEKSDPEQFKAYLKAHQQGKTDYITFCNDCARTGVEKWKVCLEEMTCTYFDQAGNNLLTEKIPSINREGA
ncbi:MAG TPA: DUF1398 family protein [Flavipsychrobacter sp.]|nr:DUF1398 family protein [Flavipsychrobacter sp.]